MKLAEEGVGRGEGSSSTTRVGKVAEHAKKRNGFLGPTTALIQVLLNRLHNLSVKTPHPHKGKMCYGEGMGVLVQETNRANLSLSYHIECSDNY